MGFVKGLFEEQDKKVTDSNSSGTQATQQSGTQAQNTYGTQAQNTYGTQATQQSGTQAQNTYGATNQSQAAFGQNQNLLYPQLANYAGGTFDAMFNPGAFQATANQGAPTSWQYDAINAQTGLPNYLGASFGTAGDIMQNGLSTANINKYMNPYLSNVADAAMAKSNEGYLRANQQTGARQASQGALGNTNNAIERAYNLDNKMEGDRAMLSNLYSGGFNTALGAANQDLQGRLQGANLGNTLTGTLGNIYGQQFSMGDQLRQAQMQASMTPYQLYGMGAQSLAQLAGQAGQQQSNFGTSMGLNTGQSTGTTTGQSTGVNTGAMTGTTTGQSTGVNTGQSTGTTTGQSTGQYTGDQHGVTTGTTTPSTMGIAGTAMKAIPAIMSMFSDERMKENIKQVGSTFDGLPIYKFNFKNSPQTQIGLMAQDVERMRPEAAGELGGPGGPKMVDYDTATKGAEQPMMAFGGGIPFLEGMSPFLGNMMGGDGSTQSSGATSGGMGGMGLLDMMGGGGGMGLLDVMKDKGIGTGGLLGMGIGGLMGRNAGGIVNPNASMTDKVTQAFHAFSNMRQKAAGGRVQSYANGGWEPTMTMGDAAMSPDDIVSTANQAEFGKNLTGLGDAFSSSPYASGNKKPQSAAGGQDEFGFNAMAQQQQRLSQAMQQPQMQQMRPMMSRGGVPGYEDGGVRWGDEGPQFESRDYETPRMGVGAPSRAPAEPMLGGGEGPRVMGSPTYQGGQEETAAPAPASWWQQGVGALNPANWGMPTFIKTSTSYDARNAPNAYDNFAHALIASSPKVLGGMAQTIGEQEKHRLAQLQADRMQRQFEAQQAQARQLALGSIDGQSTLAARTLAEQERANKAREDAEQWAHAVDPQTGEVILYNRKTGERKGGSGSVGAPEMNPLGLKKWRETALTKDLPEAKGRYDKGKEQGENFDTITKLLPYMISGKYADQELEIRRFASKFLGIGDASKIATTELVRQLTQQGVLDQLKQMRPATDLDAKFAQQGTASISNDPSTLAIFAPGLAAMGKRSAFRANLEMKFIEAGQPPFLASNEAKIEQVIKQAEREGIIPKSPWETYAQQLELGRSDGPATGPKAPGKVDHGRLDGSPAPSPKAQLLNLPDGVHDLPNGRFIKRGTILTPVSGDLGTQTNPFGKQTDIQHAGQFAYGPDGKLYRRTKNLFTDRWEEVTQ